MECECCARSTDDNTNIHNQKRLIPEYMPRTEISLHNLIYIMHVHFISVYLNVLETCYTHKHAYAYTHTHKHTRAHTASEVIILFFLLLLVQHNTAFRVSISRTECCVRVMMMTSDALHDTF